MKGALLHQPTLGQRVSIIMTRLDWAEEMTKQSIRQHHSLILETVEVFVTIVCLALVMGWTTHGTYSAVYKTPDAVKWSTTLMDGVRVDFEVCGRKEGIGIKVEEMFPTLIKEGDHFIRYLGDG